MKVTPNKKLTVQAYKQVKKEIPGNNLQYKVTLILTYYIDYIHVILQVHP